ncbi:MAG: VTT domain-containing protein [Candidatus Omnitrophota bacterium]|jgi:uncharacterized membrane protein YdjX (TVP38/TMEM64 family)
MAQKTKNILKTSLKIIVFLAFISLIIWLGGVLSENIEQIKTTLKNIPYVYSSIVFVILYVLANFVFFADVKDLLKPIGAVIFGAYISTFLIYIAEAINAFIFFNLSRLFGMAFVERVLKGKFHKLYEKLSNISFGWIFLLRFVPLVPFRILDVSFGLSKVSFKKYIWAVLLGSPLRIFWIQFILAAIGGFSMEKMMAYYRENSIMSMLTLVYFGIAVLIAVIMKRKLK